MYYALFSKSVNISTNINKKYGEKELLLDDWKIYLNYSKGDLRKEFSKVWCARQSIGVHEENGFGTINK